MDIKHNYFSVENEVQAEIEAAGYFPLTLDFPAELNEEHWHDFDSLVYILEGELTVFDTVTGECCVCGKGSRIVGSRGVLHREESAGHKALVAF